VSETLISFARSVWFVGRHSSLGVGRRPTSFFFASAILAVAFVAASRRDTRPRVSAQRVIHRLTM
jgi:hypothetical protein